MHGVVVNTQGDGIFEELSGKFTVISQERQGLLGVPEHARRPGKTGWLLQEHTKEPTHLPPGVRGLIEVFAGLDGKDKPDAPAAFTFADQRVRCGERDRPQTGQ